MSNESLFRLTITFLDPLTILSIFLAPPFIMGEFRDAVSLCLLMSKSKSYDSFVSSMVFDFCYYESSVSLLIFVTVIKVLFYGVLSDSTSNEDDFYAFIRAFFYDTSLASSLYLIFGCFLLNPFELAISTLTSLLEFFLELFSVSNPSC